MSGRAWDDGPAAVDHVSMLNTVGIYAVGVILVIIAWHVVPLFFRMLWMSIENSDYADDLRAVLSNDDVLADVDACRDAMRAGAKARLR